MIETNTLFNALRLTLIASGMAVVFPGDMTSFRASYNPQPEFQATYDHGWPMTFLRRESIIPQSTKREELPPFCYRGRWALENGKVLFISTSHLLLDLMLLVFTICLTFKIKQRISLRFGLFACIATSFIIAGVACEIQEQKVASKAIYRLNHSREIHIADFETVSIWGSLIRRVIGLGWVEGDFQRPTTVCFFLENGQGVKKFATQLEKISSITQIRFGHKFDFDRAPITLPASWSIEKVAFRMESDGAKFAAESFPSAEIETY